MPRTRKTELQANRIGQRLRITRQGLNYTLLEISVAIEINIGQLSRFEQGNFVFVSKNLQIFANFLNVQLEDRDEMNLVSRFDAARSQSDRHEAAAAAFVRALETLR